MTFFLILIMICCQFSFAVTVEIIDMCQPKIKARLQYNLRDPSGESVADITHKVLTRNKRLIPSITNRSGVISIFNTPTGLEGMDIFDNGYYMHSYGWCYNVDKKTILEHPPVMASQFRITNPNSVIKWWYGFVIHDRGNWSGQCTPSYRGRPEFFCARKKSDNRLRQLNRYEK